MNKLKTKNGIVIFVSNIQLLEDSSLVLIIQIIR